MRRTITGVPVDASMSDRMESNDAAAVTNVATVPPPQKKKQKRDRKPPPGESTVNLSEETKLPTPRHDGAHGDKILADMSSTHQTEPRTATMVQQTPYIFSPSINVSGPQGRLPGTGIHHGMFQPRHYNESSHFSSQPHMDSMRSVSAHVASLPTTTSTLLDYAAMTAPRQQEILDYRFGMNPAMFSSTQSQPAIHSNSTPSQLEAGFRIPAAMSFPGDLPLYSSDNSYGFQVVDSALDDSQSRMLSSSNSGTGIGTPLHSAASHMLEDMLRNQQYQHPRFQDVPSAISASQSMMLSSLNSGTGIATPSQLHDYSAASRNIEDMLRNQQYQQPQNLLFANLQEERDVMPALSSQGPVLSERRLISLRLPVTLNQPGDILHLNAHQVYLREQIEVFQATQDDVQANIRGRNRRIHVGQVGIRCRHCAHIPARHRQKGTMYFPATLGGVYQAAQNMSTNHIQCGVCTEMPDSVKNKFVELLPTKNLVSRAGRGYWEETARCLGLIDTEDGIAFHPYQLG